MNQNYKKSYVLDTNILLEDADNVIKLSNNSENLIIFPETVLDEIDDKKSGFEEINFQARRFARLLENAEVIQLDKPEKNEKSCSVIKIKINTEAKQTVDIHIITKDIYEVENNKTVSLKILNDRKILEVTKDYVLKNYKNVIFLSNDIMARTRAISFGLVTENIKGDREGFINFTKEIKLEELITETKLDKTDIIEYDSEYKPNNFSYSFLLPDGNSFYALIKNKKINIINVDESPLKLYVQPQNLQQKFYINAILNKQYNIAICEGIAGSGKTLISLSCAMALLKKKEYSSIVYIRNSVESLDKGEDIGYLSGNDEKLAIYNHPLKDSLMYMAKKELKKSAGGKDPEIAKELIDKRVEEYISKNNIETMWVGEMRGRTLSDSFVIIDEAQNMSNKTMQMVLSRVDDTCQVVVLGSNKQIDNLYLNKHTNALTTLINSTKKEHDSVNLYAINLEKVLRGPITEFAEDIFSS